MKTVLPVIHQKVDADRQRQQAQAEQARAEGKPLPESWCPIHQVEMQRYPRNPQPGQGSWFSHKTADGAWCKGM